MAHIRRLIDITSPSDGKHYDSISKYEKSLDRKGQWIMSEKEYKYVKEKTLDMERTNKSEKNHNHVHIDLRNDRITTSKKDEKDF